MLTENTVRDFLTELSSNSPAPGGGSVAAIAGAMGAALTSMVCNLTIGKKKYAAVQGEMERVLVASEKLRKAFTGLVDEDTAAFKTVMSALALPKETEEEKQLRSEALLRAMKTATLVPLHVMELCEEAIGLARTVAEKGNVNSISDAGVGALMIRAACLGAHFNVQTNLGSLNDQPFIQEASGRAALLLDRVESVSREVIGMVNGSISSKHQ